MTETDFRPIGDIVQDILQGLGCAYPVGGNVIDLAERRARIEGRKVGNHATIPGPVEGGSAFVIPWTKITRCAGMIGQRS